MIFLILVRKRFRGLWLNFEIVFFASLLLISTSDFLYKRVKKSLIGRSQKSEVMVPKQSLIIFPSLKIIYILKI